MRGGWRQASHAQTMMPPRRTKHPFFCRNSCTLQNSKAWSQFRDSWDPRNQNLGSSPGSTSLISLLHCQQLWSGVNENLFLKTWYPVQLFLGQYCSLLSVLMEEATCVGMTCHSVTFPTTTHEPTCLWVNARWCQGVSNNTDSLESPRLGMHTEILSFLWPSA